MPFRGKPRSDPELWGHDKILEDVEISMSSKVIKLEEEPHPNRVEMNIRYKGRLTNNERYAYECLLTNTGNWEQIFLILDPANFNLLATHVYDFYPKSKNLIYSNAAGTHLIKVVIYSGIRKRKVQFFTSTVDENSESDDAAVQLIWWLFN